MVTEVGYCGFLRQFRLSKKECSGHYMTDEKGGNGQKWHIENESNHFKTTSQYDFHGH